MTYLTNIAKRLKKRLLQLLAILLLLVIAVWYWVSVSQSNVVPPELPKGTYSGKQYFEASFPALSPGTTAVFTTVTLYIPNTFVDFRYVTFKSNGAAVVPLDFELPEKTPTALSPPRPWEGLNYRSPEAEALRKQFLKTHNGSFRVTLNAGFNSAEEFMNTKVQTTDLWGKTTVNSEMVQLSPVAGLLRYAELTCYQQHAGRTAEEVMKLVAGHKAQMKNSIRDSNSIITEADTQSQPDDPPIPANCVIERLRPTLFTPVGTPEEQAVYVSDCDLYDCDLDIRIRGLPARIRVPLRLLPRWREIVLPTQELLRSFLIKPDETTMNTPVVFPAFKN